MGWIWIAYKYMYVKNICILQCCCYSVIKSCPILCDPTDCSMPASSALHYLPESAQIHVHCIGDAFWPSHPLLLSSRLPASGSFPMSLLFTSSGQRTGASASASVLPMNTQGWFPSGLTGLISLPSKGLSRVFSSTITRNRQFFGTQAFLWSNFHICTWLL